MVQVEATVRATASGSRAGEELYDAFTRVRAQSEALCEPLSPEDAAGQSMRDASPAKWHLAHTTWFFETFVLGAQGGPYRPFHPRFRFMFNSYYNTVGEQYPRPQRGLLTRPSLEEVLDYRRHVDKHMRRVLLSDGDLDEGARRVLEIGLEHEQQHQELILTDIKHLFSFSPLYPSYREASVGNDAGGQGKPGWIEYPGGLQWCGHPGGSFGFDNEYPRHRRYLEAFALADRPVTNGEFLEFIRDGGYGTPELWLSDGWDTLRANRWVAPLYWHERDGQWFVFTLSGLETLNPDEPLCHVSYYEADAYARWRDARLPSEGEWEYAASQQTVEGNFVESGVLHPRAVTTRDEQRPSQLYGDVWEWTSSAYGAYPGYQAPAGALGEYNGKFMSNQMVLRGGSCVSPCAHIRASYRNFFPPDARWQFSGIRLARDVVQ